MNEIETRELIRGKMSTISCLEYKNDKALNYCGTNYGLRPDESFLFANSYFLVEYENNNRPVESISKYFWLLKNTDWLTHGISISLLIIITNVDLERKYKMRIESIEVLGIVLEELYPGNFKFGFLRNHEISKTNIDRHIDILL